MFDNIRAPRGPEFRPRSSCCLRGPPRRTIHFSSSSDPRLRFIGTYIKIRSQNPETKMIQIRDPILATSLKSKCKCTKTHNHKVNIWYGINENGDAWYPCTWLTIEGQMRTRRSHSQIKSNLIWAQLSHSSIKRQWWASSSSSYFILSFLKHCCQHRYHISP